MTVFNDTFDTAAPDGGDDPAEADNNMRRIQRAVQEREDVDHHWPLTGTEVSDAETGEHKKVTLRVGSAPTAVANKGFVYIKDVSNKAELFYRDEDGNEIQITSGGILKSLNLAGNQTAAGVKTFSSSPIVPTPTTSLQAATKGYVDAHGTVQVVNTQTGAVNTGTTVFPNDDTIPQNTEGDEYMTLAITPTNASNKLKIDVVFVCSHTALGAVVAALFQDSTANALAAAWHDVRATTAAVTVKFTHYMAAGTTSETTFKVRGGGQGSGTLTFNGGAGVRKYGGVLASSITITEIKV